MAPRAGTSKHRPPATVAPRSQRLPRVAPARVCAYTVVRRVFERGAYADRALRAHARDRALAMRLAYGTVQRRGTLDHLIEQLAERPCGRLDAPVTAALRMGMYELLFLEGAPDRAVVADAVELAKVAGVEGESPHGSGRRGRGGHGLVNAVLRRTAREGATLLAELDDRTPEGAAVKHSHPEWVARLWWSELGAEDARALMAYDNEPGEVALRVNTLRAQPEAVAAELLAGVALHRDPGIPEALVLDGPWDLHASPLWRAGAVLAQSRGAMLPALALAPRPGERVLDVCAAPGGKTTHLAALMEGRGEVVAVERDPRRAAELRRTVQRVGAQGCVRVVEGDATLAGGGPLEGEAPFDRVLVDPPCTGLGTLQARADLRWRVGPGDMERLAYVQRAILAAAAQAVRPGGVLVYSTCTLSPSENERQVTAFLESNPDFALDDLGAELPGRSKIGRHWGRCVLTLPHRDRTAGFFIARLIRA
jgi:16S rRNA (cytosine967-C5)-methyltransferase